MFLESFFNTDQNQISISREQGSSFAKTVANDFNPLHDVEAKKFVVPGDLLFSIVLHNGGLYQQMAFNFDGMVTDQSLIRVHPSKIDQLQVLDQHDKACMSVSFAGHQTHDELIINKLTQAYVRFSGKAFPHILVPLMQEQAMMINPARPMVMYQSMRINLQRFDFTDVLLEMSNATMKVYGKRANVSLDFEFISQGEVVGTGSKQMVLGGLRPFNQVDIDRLVCDYSARKQAELA